MQIEIGPNILTLSEAAALSGNGNIKISLTDDAVSCIKACREYLDHRLEERPTALYGINTGFGSLCDTQIAEKDLRQLQINLIRSHACGMGAEVLPEIVRLMLALKIKAFSYGHSGIRMETVNRLVDFYNADILPVIFMQGSLGASGDLAPLAHFSLPLIGEGEVVMEGKRMSASVMLKKQGWEPLEPRSKEGLALLNGTQFMLAYAIYITDEARKLYRTATRISALSLDAFDCKTYPFHPLLHKIRPHKGQVRAAQAILDLLEDSEIAAQHKKHVQDPYSFRCIPQVHGASEDVIEYAAGIFETELNSVSDNPNIFVEEDAILSGGNFHGQPLAMALDYLAIGLSELASISERRTYQLLSGTRGLPPFLVPDPGLNSGLMIPQYLAAGIVSQNKQLCTPASVDSIPSSNGQEDHVSMGANAATKCFKVFENLRKVLAIELICASQALQFRAPMATGSKLIPLLNAFREKVPFISHDRQMHPDLKRAVAFLKSRDFD